MKVSAKITVKGIVQGVGFRPFIHRLARENKLSGWVINTSFGVITEVDGEKINIEKFYYQISKEAPPLADIREKSIGFSKAKGYKKFAIKESLDKEGRFSLISPDISICQDCLNELFDARDRRFRYPFINCTNCGPRFTIIKDVPYDRPKTTMKKFIMCPSCLREYEDISNRRYHAQPNACFDCGPQVSLYKNKKRISRGKEAITQTINLLKEGNIMAIKGIGGFHLACDAENNSAVELLRKRKNRPYKPLAIMSPDEKEIKKYCYLSPQERKILQSPQRPIILLRKKIPSTISAQVAPNNNYLGVMLPYTPLHYLILKNNFLALVMTSGNKKDEPIQIENEEAMKNLEGLVDYFLTHNRDIHNRCDDSIVQEMDGEISMLRRARGYVPFPVDLGIEFKNILACGAELKNTFCLTQGRYAFVSQYIGDMQDYLTYEYFQQALVRFKKIFRIKPRIIAYDMHPQYLSTKFALEQKRVKLIPIQHHHAHIASCLAENGIKEKVIGVSFDGIGYGSDGKIWGGEFMVADYANFERVAYLKYIPMPGGDKATEEPWRMALSYLYDVYGEKFKELNLDIIRRHKKEIPQILKMIKNNINCPLTSSMGRFFDAVSALIGIREEITYEAQAAIEMEMKVREGITSSYKFAIVRENGIFILKVDKLIKAIVKELEMRKSIETMAAKFHNTIAKMVLETCQLIQNETGIKKVALSGGVFQNRVLFKKAKEMLKKSSFKVYYHKYIPTNDGGISLGQAIIANEKLRLEAGS